jgi:hypothetical protein
MAGVTGRLIQAAYARATTWGTPTSVTRQVLLNTTAGLTPRATIVDDETFNQTFLKRGDVGEFAAVTTDVELQLRYEDVDSWIAGAMGSASAPLVVSSQAANSLVAYGHGLSLASELWPIWTLAINMVTFVLEVPSFKIKGFSVRTGDGGRMVGSFPIVGQRSRIDSTTNTSATIANARAAAEGLRVMRRQGVLRMNPTSAGSLTASDEITIAREIAFNATRAFAEDDYVLNSLGIIEPDENAYPEFSFEITYARMNTVSANSVVSALLSGDTFKASLEFTGPNVNSTTARLLRFEFPALQCYEARIEATGPDQVRPVGMFRAKAVNTAPTGMGANSFHASGLTAPFRVTLINANSQNLLA